MKITTNASKVISKLQKYSDGIESKLRKLMEKLADAGLSTAIQEYGKAQYDGTKSDYPEGPRWVSDNRLEIAYSGSTILFIEFGTGVHYASDSHPQADEFGYTRGGYGHHLGKLDSWRYVGDPGTNGEKDEAHPGFIKTYGNPANKPMYLASKEMRDKVIEIAREVFHG